MAGENGHQKWDENHPFGNLSGPPFSGFPSLPIVTVDPPKRTQSEKYGGLFYVGIGGLAILLALVGWFSVRLWTLRDVWTNIYVLHDRSNSDDRRIEAAFALSRDPRLTTRQRWDVALRRDLPELARYLIAESIGAEIVLDDPRGYPTAVAKSADWPDWLRLLLARPLALAAAGGASVPAGPLEELRGRPDPMISLWAAFALAISSKPNDDAARMLEEAATTPGPAQELAKILQEARSAPEAEQAILLDRATAWLRTHHPDAVRIWKGWEIREGKMVRSPDS